MVWYYKSVVNEETGEEWRPKIIVDFPQFEGYCIIKNIETGEERKVSLDDMYLSEEYMMYGCTSDSIWIPASQQVAGINLAVMLDEPPVMSEYDLVHYDRMQTYIRDNTTSIRLDYFPIHYKWNEGGTLSLGNKIYTPADLIYSEFRDYKIDFGKYTIYDIWMTQGQGHLYFRVNDRQEFAKYCVKRLAMHI